MGGVSGFAVPSLAVAPVATQAPTGVQLAFDLRLVPNLSEKNGFGFVRSIFPESSKSSCFASWIQLQPHRLQIAFLHRPVFSPDDKGHLRCTTARPRLSKNRARFSVQGMSGFLRLSKTKTIFPLLSECSYGPGDATAGLGRRLSSPRFSRLFAPAASLAALPSAVSPAATSPGDWRSIPNVMTGIT